MKNTELDFDWSALPKWANWIAMDQEGDWYYYSDKPQMDDDHPIWVSSEFNDAIPPEYYPKNFTGDWANSLLEVPKNKTK